MIVNNRHIGGLLKQMTIIENVVLLFSTLKVKQIYVLLTRSGK